MARRRPGHLAIAACVCAAAGLLAACSSARAPAPARPAPSAPARLANPAPSPASPAPGPTTGLLPPPPGVTDRLIAAQARVRAGTPLKVTLLVTYRGGTPVNLSRGCRPQYAVVLASRRFPPDVAFPSVCSAKPFIIRPGVNRLRITVVTTYRECTQSARQVTRRVPLCRSGPQIMPALPAGRYELVLVGDALPLPAPAPVAVTLSRGAR